MSGFNAALAPLAPAAGTGLVSYSVYAWVIYNGSLELFSDGSASLRTSYLSPAAGQAAMYAPRTREHNIRLATGGNFFDQVVSGLSSGWNAVKHIAPAIEGALGLIPHPAAQIAAHALKKVRGGKMKKKSGRKGGSLFPEDDIVEIIKHGAARGDIKSSTKFTRSGTGYGRR